MPPTPTQLLMGVMQIIFQDYDGGFFQPGLSNSLRAQRVPAVTCSIPQMARRSPRWCPHLVLEGSPHLYLDQPRELSSPGRAGHHTGHRLWLVLLDTAKTSTVASHGAFFAGMFLGDKLQPRGGARENSLPLRLRRSAELAVLFFVSMGCCSKSDNPVAASSCS